MKKLLSAALAVAMVAGATTTALAKTVYVVDDGGLVTVDTDVLDGGSYFMPGVTYTMKLEDGSYPVDAEFMEGYRLNVSVVEGKTYVSSCKLVQKNGEYYLEFTPKNATSKYLGEVNDVVVEITATEKGTTKDYKILSQREADRYNEQTIEGDKEVVIGDVVYTKYVTQETFSISYPDEVYINDDDYDVDNDNPIVVASDSISRSTLHFGDVAQYDARFSGREKKLNLGYSIAENPSIVNANPDAEMTFISWNGAPTFVSNAELRVYSDGAKYLYEIKSDNSLTLLDAEQGNGFMRYRTQGLTAYVASDRALKGASGTSGTSGNNSSSSTPSTPSTPAGGSERTLADIVPGAVPANRVAEIYAKSGDYMTPATLKAVAQKLGGNARLVVNNLAADKRIGYNTLESSGNQRVVVQLSMPLTVMMGQQKNNVNLGLKADVSATRNLFNTYYNNEIVVIGLQHQGAFGAGVRVAAWADLGKLNTNSLHFYTYDSAKNSFSKIGAPSYNIGSDGYLYFTTTQGGDILITDKVLTAK